MTILISEKVDLIAKKITKNNEWPLYKDEKINPSRRHSNLKCVFINKAAKYSI